MGDQMEPGPPGQHRQELQGVVDWALGEGAVLETINVLAELPLQVGPGLAAGQRAEAAQGVGAGAVDEDQRRAPGQPGEAGGAALEPVGVVEGAAGPGVQPRGAGEPLFDHRDDGLGAEG